MFIWGKLWLKDKFTLMNTVSCVKTHKERILKAATEKMRVTKEFH